MVPAISNYVHNAVGKLSLPRNAQIIDIGNGESHLPEALLSLGYINITVLDISATAIEKAKKKMSNKAWMINWIVSDILEFQPAVQYDVWHDRATFHFLRDKGQQQQYAAIASQAVRPIGHLLIGTLAQDGPESCSGLPIQKYSQASLYSNFKHDFDLIECVQENHLTPTQGAQSFLHCSYKKK